MIFIEGVWLPVGCLLVEVPAGSRELRRMHLSPGDGGHLEAEGEREIENTHTHTHIITYIHSHSLTYNTHTITHTLSLSLCPY